MAMSGRLSVLLATRSAGSPSGPGIRHIWASSSKRQDFAAEAVLGGASKFPGQNSILGKIHKLETDFAGMKVTTGTLSKRQDLINTYQDRADADMKWLTKVGIGSGALGIGGAIFKLYYHDASQTNQIKAYIREIGGNLESRMDRMESRMERIESKMDKRIGNLESKMDQKIGNLELKMDRRMDEIVSYLKVKKGWW